MPHTALRTVPAVQPIRRTLPLLRVVRLILRPPLAVLPAVLKTPTRSKSLNFIQENNLYPFAVANPDTVIYVSGNKAEWKYERSDIGLKGETYDGIVPAWVYSGRGFNLVSEFGEIAYKRRGFGLIRTA